MPKLSPKKPTASVPAKPKTRSSAKVVKESVLFAQVAKNTVFNILQNSKYILDACKCKTLTTEHLTAISLIQANIAEQGIAFVPKGKSPKVMSGGTVLPSEYFGVNSGRYVDISTLSSAEVQLTADTTLARAEHPIKLPMSGGAATASVPLVLIKNAIKEFQQKSKFTFKVSKDALEMIHVSVQENVKDIVEVAKKEIGTSFTATQLTKFAKEHPKFMHMGKVHKLSQLK
jgi:hypothetical protein